MARKRILLTDEQREEVFLRYMSGEDAYAIAESFDVCANNVLNAVRKLGGTIRDKRTARTTIGHREDAFDVITPQSAYWIGFYFADGWIQQRKVGAPLVCVAVATCDEPHLMLLRDFLGSGHKITRHFSGNSTIGDRAIAPGTNVRLTVGSSSLSAALERHGMCRKSLTRVASASLIDSRDFWRGMVDGDGYVSTSETKTARLGLCGGEVLMQQFIDFLTRNRIRNALHVTERLEKTGIALPRVEMVCGTAVRAIELLYRDAQISLDRKQTVADSIVASFT